MIKIATWNIQNLGVTKANLKGPSPYFKKTSLQARAMVPEYIRSNFILEAIAKIIKDGSYDIVNIIELNTTDFLKAIQITNKLVEILNSKSNLNYSFVLSSNTGLEFYGFLIKDITKTVPLTLTVDLSHAKIPVVLTKEGIQEVSQGTYLSLAPAKKSTAISAQGKYGPYFPLIQPDLKTRSNSRFPREFGGSRLPCLALFEIKKKVLAMLSLHSIPWDWGAASQLNNLPYFSLVSSPGNVQFKAESKTKKVDHVVITGDFNLEYEPGKQSIYTGFLERNYNILNKEKTLLENTPWYSNPPKTTQDLRSQCIDNFITGIEQPSPFASEPVFDVPTFVLNNNKLFKKALGSNYRLKKLNENEFRFQRKVIISLDKLLASGRKPGERKIWFSSSRTNRKFMENIAVMVLWSRIARNIFFHEIGKEKIKLLAFIYEASKPSYLRAFRTRKLKSTKLPYPCPKILQHLIFTPGTLNSFSKQLREDYEEHRQDNQRTMVRFIGPLNSLVDSLYFSRMVSDHLPITVGLSLD